MILETCHACSFQLWDFVATHN